MRRPIAVLLLLGCILVIVLVAALAGVLSDVASDALLALGGVSLVVWNRSIAAWVRTIGENVSLLSHYQSAQSWFYLVVGATLTFFGLSQMIADLHHQ